MKKIKKFELNKIKLKFLAFEIDKLFNIEGKMKLQNLVGRLVEV